MTTVKLRRPELRAEFELDEHMRPVFIEKDGLRHFKIKLSVDHAAPDVYSVIYELHPTYFNPLRESEQRITGFAENLTSFGDYEISVTINGKSGINYLREDLSSALRRGHGEQPSLAISEALEYVENH